MQDRCYPIYPEPFQPNKHLSYLTVLLLINDVTATSGGHNKLLFRGPLHSQSLPRRALRISQIYCGFYLIGLQYNKSPLEVIKLYRLFI